MYIKYTFKLSIDIKKIKKNPNMYINNKLIIFKLKQERYLLKHFIIMVLFFLVKNISFVFKI